MASVSFYSQSFQSYTALPTQELDLIECYQVTSLDLTSPVGGESYHVDDSTTITWDDTGSVADVKLEYSDDNGSSWNTIIASVSNTGTYVWTIPDAISDDCLVRVSDVLDSDNASASAAVFSIIAALPPPDPMVGGGRLVKSWMGLVDWIRNKLDGIREWSNKDVLNWGFASEYPQIAGDFSALVVKVHDGDTITLRTDFRDFDFPLRIANIDAPEMNEGGEVARDWLRSRILGKMVVVRVNPDNRVGKYGRLIGSVYHAGFDVADEMRMRGLVWKFGQRNMFSVPKLDKFLQEGKVTLGG